MADNKLIRIGIDAHMLGDRSGGNETYYKNLLEKMEVPDGMEIYIFVTKEADVTALKDKFRIIYFKEKGATYRNLIELPLLSLKYKLDLLHVQYFIPFVRPCKVVVTIHDICFEHYKDIFTRREYIRQKLLIPYAAKKSKAIFTVSEFSKQDIANCYRINPDKIVVTYNGVNDAFRPIGEEDIDRAKLNYEFGIEKDYILTVCNLQPRKNLVRLIQAFKLLKKEYSKKIQLVIVGKRAWMYEPIIAEAVDTNTDIIFTDYVNQETLVRLYNGARGFVFPSLFEGFGIPPLEALACGTNVAVSNSSSLPEVIGENGLFFDPYDCQDMKEQMKTLLATERTIQLSGEIKKFSCKESSKKVIDTYNSLLGLNYD